MLKRIKVSIQGPQFSESLKLMHGSKTLHTGDYDTLMALLFACDSVEFANADHGTLATVNESELMLQLAVSKAA